jgi:hypothetical protein
MNTNPEPGPEFSGNISPEVEEELSMLKKEIQRRHPNVTDEDLEVALLDYHREAVPGDSKEHQIASILKRLGIRPTE